MVVGPKNKYNRVFGHKAEYGSSARSNHCSQGEMGVQANDLYFLNWKLDTSSTEVSFIMNLPVEDSMTALFQSFTNNVKIRCFGGFPSSEGNLGALESKGRSLNLLNTGLILNSPWTMEDGQNDPSSQTNCAQEVLDARLNPDISEMIANYLYASSHPGDLPDLIIPDQWGLRLK